MNPPFICSHPLLQVGLTRLRDRRTPHADFRRHLREASALLFTEATRTLETRATEVETPLTRTTGRELARPLVLAPVLRAGLGMVDGIWPLAPTARLAHIGICRDEATARPQSYYSKFPPEPLDEADVFLLDPMLATGGSAVAAADQLKAHGARHLRFVCVLAAPPGVAAFQAAHPEIPLFTAALDERLDERSFIVPGLGDAGDRYFGTVGPEAGE